MQKRNDPLRQSGAALRAMKWTGLATHLTTTVAGIIIGSVIVARLVFLGLQYPDSWKQISYGQPRDEVHQKVAGVIDLSSLMKDDVWEAPCAIGFWQMHVGYDQQQHVSSKRLIFYVGTRETYKAFYFL
jgi:hypothetical protein